MRVLQLRKCEVRLVTWAVPHYMRRYGKVKGEGNSIQRRNRRAGGADASRKRAERGKMEERGEEREPPVAWKCKTQPQKRK